MHPLMELQRMVLLKLFKNIHDGVVNRTEGCTIKIKVLFLAILEFIETAVQLRSSQQLYNLANNMRNELTPVRARARSEIGTSFSFGRRATLEVNLSTYW